MNSGSMNIENSLVLRTHNIGKIFTQGREDIVVLKDVNLEIKSGEIVAIVGESGSGKSTLLQILGTLMKPTRGEIEICGKIVKYKQNEIDEIRLKDLGFIYQYHHLLKDFTALENVAMPQILAGKSPAEANKYALELLEKVGLGDRAKHKPAELSGGQQQRVAVARAFANSPKLIFADEPTGNLDNENSQKIMDLIKEFSKEKQISFVIATHSKEISTQCDSIYKISNANAFKIAE